MNPSDVAMTLWHHVWFQAAEANAVLDEPDLMTADEAESYGMTAVEVDEYNQWQAERDRPAEHARHVATFEAFRHVYELIGYPIAYDYDVVAGFPLWSDWLAMCEGVTS